MNDDDKRCSGISLSSIPLTIISQEFKLIMGIRIDKEIKLILGVCLSLGGHGKLAGWFFSFKAWFKAGFISLFERVL